MATLLGPFICLMTLVVTVNCYDKYGKANQAGAQFSVDSNGAKTKLVKRSATTTTAVDGM